MDEGATAASKVVLLEDRDVDACLCEAGSEGDTAGTGACEFVSAPENRTEYNGQGGGDLPTMMADFCFSMAVLSFSALSFQKGMLRGKGKKTGKRDRGGLDI